MSCACSGSCSKGTWKGGEIKVTPTINGVVDMGTRREKAMKKKDEEEDRWRELFPDIKKCVVLIPRQKLDRLKVLQEGTARRAGDPQPGSQGWMDLDKVFYNSRLRRFVKKVEVKVRENSTTAKGSRRYRGRGSDVIKADSAQSRLHEQDIWKHPNKCTNITTENADNITTSDVDHNYCLHTGSPNNQSPHASLAPCCGHIHSCSCSAAALCARDTEKRNLPNIVFRKVSGNQWVLRKPHVEEEDEAEEDRGKSTVAEEMVIRTKSLQLTKRRRTSCRMCAGCLREDCGKCIYCRDMKKFGGPQTKKQKCLFRVCVMLQSNWSSGSSTARRHHRHHWRRRREVPDTTEEEDDDKTERWGQRNRRRDSDDGTWTSPLTHMEEEEQEEEEPKKETSPPEAGELLSGAVLTGTHLQLNLTLDSSHLTPSMLSDTLSTLSGLLPQAGTVLQVLHAPPPSLHALLLQPKDEEEGAEINTYILMGRERGLTEGAGTKEEGRPHLEAEEGCTEGVMERGKYYDVEVTVPVSDSEEEMLIEVTDDVTASEVTYKRPECISLSSPSFCLLGRSDDVTCRRGLRRLLQALRRTVLPAHWVAVLSDGPVLQLLQCSRLSSMADTIVHIQPDRCFYITVRNRQLPAAHTLYRRQRISQLSQLVSLLLHLEQLTVCQGSQTRALPRLLDTPLTCHLLVAPPCLTCLPCLLGGEEDEEEEGLSVTSDLDLTFDADF